MKSGITPVQRERRMREEDFIVSKTDLKGRITYANRIFSEFAGYSVKELLGAQHNIVRHPDMPRSVFQLMWNTIQGQQEFFGYVKNLRSDGSYYWVFANVTPSYDTDNRHVGYYSVRRAPRMDAVQRLDSLYAHMVTAEREAGPRGAITAGTAVLTEHLSRHGVDYEHFVLEI